MSEVTISGIRQTEPVNTSCRISNDRCARGLFPCRTVSVNDCGPGRWFYSVECAGTCGNTVVADACIYRCSGPDLRICPTISDQGANSATFTAEGAVNRVLSSDAVLDCTYFTSTFESATYDQMLNISQYRSTTDPREYNRAFNAYCFQPVNEDCPFDTTTGAQMPRCARISTTGDAGLLCKEWFNFLDDTNRDNFILNYCTETQTSDCKCAVPQPDDVFRVLNSAIGLAGSPQCWWVPCKLQTGAYLIPSRFLDQDVCPQEITICQTVINFAESEGTDIDVNIVDNYTGCDVQTNGPSPETINFLERYWWIILLGIGAFILVIVIIYYIV